MWAGSELRLCVGAASAEWRLVSSASLRLRKLFSRLSCSISMRQQRSQSSSDPPSELKLCSNRVFSESSSGSSAGQPHTDTDRASFSIGIIVIKRAEQRAAQSPNRSLILDRAHASTPKPRANRKNSKTNSLFALRPLPIALCSLRARQIEGSSSLQPLAAYNYNLIPMRVGNPLPTLNQKITRTPAIANALADRRRYNSPNLQKIDSLPPSSYQKENLNKIIEAQIDHSPSHTRTNASPNRQHQYFFERSGQKESVSKMQTGEGAIHKRGLGERGKAQAVSSTNISAASTSRRPVALHQDLAALGYFKSHSNDAPYKIVVHAQRKPEPPYSSHPNLAQPAPPPPDNRPKFTSHPLIALTPLTDSQIHQEQDSNTSVVIESKDMYDSRDGLEDRTATQPNVLKESKEVDLKGGLKESKGGLKESNQAGLKESKGGLRESKGGLRESKSMVGNPLLESSVIQSMKGGLRRCLSLQFQRKQEKKMRLRDYLHLHEITGARKRVAGSGRVRECDEAVLEGKIKREIEANVRRVRERLVELEQMGQFQGDKLMLHNINTLVKDKLAAACDEIHSLILRYQQELH